MHILALGAYQDRRRPERGWLATLLLICLDSILTLSRLYLDSILTLSLSLSTLPGQQDSSPPRSAFFSKHKTQHPIDPTRDPPNRRGSPPNPPNPPTLQPRTQTLTLSLARSLVPSGSSFLEDPAPTRGQFLFTRLLKPFFSPPAHYLLDASPEPINPSINHPSTLPPPELFRDFSRPSTNRNRHRHRRRRWQISSQAQPTLATLAAS